MLFAHIKQFQKVTPCKVLHNAETINLRIANKNEPCSGKRGLTYVSDILHQAKHRLKMNP